MRETELLFHGLRVFCRIRPEGRSTIDSPPDPAELSIIGVEIDDVEEWIDWQLDDEDPDDHVDRNWTALCEMALEGA